jgi:hypothetical protein
MNTQDDETLNPILLHHMVAASGLRGPQDDGYLLPFVRRHPVQESKRTTTETFVKYQHMETTTKQTLRSTFRKHFEGGHQRIIMQNPVLASWRCHHETLRSRSRKHESRFTPRLPPDADWLTTEWQTGTLTVRVIANGNAQPGEQAGAACVALDPMPSQVFQYKKCSFGAQDIQPHDIG